MKEIIIKQQNAQSVKYNIQDSENFLIFLHAKFKKISFESKTSGV